ncbi:MAG: alpha/beta hydrolase [Cyclobacteriaceae bacterium]|nr:alpha/beta hydrolase [Cyclobacteriaceae bacterium]
MKHLIIVISFMSLFFTHSFAQEKIILWPDGAPLAKGNTDKDQPYMTVWKPETQNKLKSAVIIFPGGGYQMLADDHEGKQVAKWFNDRGVTAFILYYRLGMNSSGYQHPVPLMDAERAMQHVRYNAKKFNIEGTKIGVMGFSAGGHLASTLGTHFKEGEESHDPLETVSSRPSFLILGYPVISFTEEFTHKGSRDNLIGKKPSQEEVVYLSNELQVTKNTPITFLVSTSEDKAVPPQNSIAFYLALQKAGVPAELHIYQKGRHGLGLINENDPVFSSWATRLEDWLTINNFLPFLGTSESRH